MDLETLTRERAAYDAQDARQAMQDNAECVNNVDPDEANDDPYGAPDEADMQTRNARELEEAKGLISGALDTEPDTLARAMLQWAIAHNREHDFYWAVGWLALAPEFGEDKNHERFETIVAYTREWYPDFYAPTLTARWRALREEGEKREEYVLSEVA